jgi:hypothetical protein
MNATIRGEQIMSNSKLEALIKEKKPKKEYVGPAQLKVKKSVDINKFADAVVEGKMIVPVDGWVIYERKRSGKPVLHMGRILNVDDDGNVNIWDETMQQCFGFNLNGTIPIIKVYEK